MVSAFYFVGRKQKFGRARGAAPVQGDGRASTGTRTTPTSDGGMPGGLWKPVGRTTRFRPNFFISGKVAYYDTGFGLSAARREDHSFTLDYVNGVGLGSYARLRGRAVPRTIGEPRRQLLLHRLRGQQRAEVRLRLPRITTTAGAATTATSSVWVSSAAAPAGGRQGFRNPGWRIRRQILRAPTWEMRSQRPLQPQLSAPAATSRRPTTSESAPPGQRNLLEPPPRPRLLRGRQQPLQRKTSPPASA